MKKDIILLDLDGTIIDDNYIVSERLQKLLLKIKKDIDICIVTGRSVSDAYRYYKLLELDTPMICYNGAYAFYPYNRKDLFCKYFEAANHLIKYVFRHYGEYIDNIAVSDKYNTYFLNNNNEFLCDMMIDEELPVFYVDKNVMIKMQNVHRIILSVKTVNIQDIIDDLKGKYSGIDIYGWKNRENIIDISGNKQNKWKTVQKVFKQVGRENKIIAIGDARNDLEMILEADIGILMKNAPEEIRKKVRYISKYDNNHDGAYWALTEIFNKYK